LQCGYDSRGNLGTQCSECGSMLRVVVAALDTSHLVRIRWESLLISVLALVAAVAALIGLPRSVDELFFYC